MKKLLILSVFLFGFVFALNVALAQGEAATSTDATATVAQEARVTSADLGVADPGILPTSWLYFTKNWGRAIQRAFTFNPVKKAALELDIANRQAAEIAKMKEVAPDRADAIAKASQNYQNNMDRLKTRLEALKETSQNPNVDKLMENLADRAVKHQQLFDELKQKFADNPDMKQRMDAMQNKMQEALIKIPEKFDSPEKFKERMQKAIELRPDSLFKEMRGMEMMQGLEDKLPENRRAVMEGIKDNLMKKFGERINTMPEDTQKIFMAPQVLEKMPGDPEMKARMLEEIQGHAQLPPEMGKRMEEMQNKILEGAVRKGEITKEKAESAIAHAEKTISEAEAAVSRALQIKNLLDEAKKHLDEAKTALSSGDYGKAFGQAISADRIARNGLRSGAAPIPTPGGTLPVKRCMPRPACLDATPRCLLPEPIGGWCPSSSGGIAPRASESGTTNLLPPLPILQPVPGQ